MTVGWSRLLPLSVRTDMRLIMLIIVAVLLGVSIGRAQTGFQLTGPLTFGGFYGGNPTWVVGKVLDILVADPSLQNRMRELEGKRVRIILQPVE
jgi:hypothetical protein